MIAVLLLLPWCRETWLFCWVIYFIVSWSTPLMMHVAVVFLHGNYCDLYWSLSLNCVKIYYYFHFCTTVILYFCASVWVAVLMPTEEMLLLDSPCGRNSFLRISNGFRDSVFLVHLLLLLLSLCTVKSQLFLVVLLMCHYTLHWKFNCGQALSAYPASSRCECNVRGENYTFYWTCYKMVKCNIYGEVINPSLNSPAHCQM